MNVLVIDDSDYKIEALERVLAKRFAATSVVVARSFISGLKELESYTPDVVLLDMSLPTYDPGQPGRDGRMRIYGGREILVEMELLALDAKVVVITQFDIFGEPPNTKDLLTLNSELKQEFPTHYAGTVYYNNRAAGWENDLVQMLQEL